MDGDADLFQERLCFKVGTKMNLPLIRPKCQTRDLFYRLILPKILTEPEKGKFTMTKDDRINLREVSKYLLKMKGRKITP
jgi:hypothetical protein